MTLAEKKAVSSRKPRLSNFARRLLAAWKSHRLPATKVPVIVAVSGGADSAALLLGLDELVKSEKLSISLVVAHLDHGLRAASRDDAAWVVAFAKQLGYPCVKRRADVRKLATESGDNLEQAARRARYDFLKATAKKEHSQLILTAHTLDDQAETVLLRLLRGSAAEGLAGIDAVRLLDARSSIQLARPLVSWARRSDSEDFCRERRVEFRQDEMNQDETFSRVRVRKQLLPLMHSFNSKIVEALGRTATLLREDAGALSEEAGKLLKHAATQPRENSAETKANLLSVSIMAEAPAAVRRRALRMWIERERGHLRRLEMVHLLAIDQLLVGSRGRTSGAVARRRECFT